MKMIKLTLLTSLFLGTACAGNDIKKVTTALHKAAELATGPCAQKIAAAAIVCSAEVAAAKQ